MTNRVFDFGAQRVVMGHGIIENAPVVFLHEGLRKNPESAKEPSKKEMTALTENGVILRFASLEGAQSVIDAIVNAVKNFEEHLRANQPAEDEVEAPAEEVAEAPAEEVTEVVAEEVAEVEVLDEPAFKSKRKAGYGK